MVGKFLCPMFNFLLLFFACSLLASLKANNNNYYLAYACLLAHSVPPQIIESQSTHVAEVMEYSNISLQCKANGHPKPSIIWRRDDGLPIKLIGGDNANGTSSAASTDNSSKSNLESSAISSEYDSIYFFLVQMLAN